MDTGCHRKWSAIDILAIGSLLLACGAPRLSASSSVELAPDRKALLVTSTNPAIVARLTLERLPTESTTAPGLSFRPERFDLVHASPDGRYAAFSTAGHHSLVGLLNLVTMAVREIDVVTEGEVVAFHWATDSRLLVYENLPASGYRGVKAYDVQSSEHLVVPRLGGKSPSHITFEGWGKHARELVLIMTDIRSNERETTAVTLIPRR